jgi:nickel transport protein
MHHVTSRLWRTLILTVIVAAGGVHEATAHRVNLFAYVDGGKIVTESWFSKSSRVRGGAVEVFDAASGEKLLSGTTDDQGSFAFDIPQAARDKKADLRIVLRAGEGHGNETVIKAREYLSTPATAAPAAPEPASSQAPVQAPAATPVATAQASPPPPGTSAPPVAPQAAAPVSADPALVAAMDKLIDAKLAPVRSMLAEAMDPAPSMTEIIGGVGWIFGLVGVAAYVKSRKG